jgi:sugar phosphate isomerase/epimerase
MPVSDLTRRAFLGSVSAASLAPAATPWKLSIFSKHLHWAEWPEMAAVAKQIGFDGIDLTVRKGGHVAPERAAEDLPKAADIIRKAGLELTMITTDIVDARTLHAETMIKTAGSLGVRHYRFGDFRYKDGIPLPEQLEACKPRIKELVALNKTYGVCAMYHTHSGIGRVGASQWDLWLIFKDFDSRYVGFNYDIGHATVEGGFGGWMNSTRLAAALMRGIAVKDFVFAKNEKGEWRPQWCPLGQGMVNLPKFFSIVRESGFQGPIQIHYEYKMGGADTGQKKITIEKSQVVEMLREDLNYLRGILA